MAFLFSTSMQHAGGHFDFMGDQALNVLAPAKAGLIRAYAATTSKRLAVAPALPTVAESGLPGFGITVWFGIYAPQGTPKPVIAKLSKALQQALLDAEVKDRLAKSGAETVSSGRATPEALRAHLQAEIARWVPLIEKAGVKVQSCVRALAALDPYVLTDEDRRRSGGRLSRLTRAC
jgi:tripartite-type tricarboxylate transporter receptor subunit TctC